MPHADWTQRYPQIAAMVQQQGEEIMDYDVDRERTRAGRAEPIVGRQCSRLEREPLYIEDGEDNGPAPCEH